MYIQTKLDLDPLCVVLRILNSQDQYSTVILMNFSTDATHI
jgi:hypothetical protein